jgi:hypothetical protein
VPLHNESRDTLQMNGAHGVAMIQESGRVVPWLVVCAIVSGLSVALSVFAIYASQKSERETRMLEYYVMEVDGKLMRAGIIKPEESWSAKQRKNGEHP